MKKLLPAALLLCQLIFAQEKLAIPYRQGNLYGLCDTLGNVLVKPRYNAIKQFCYFTDKNRTSRFLVKDKNTWKVVNSAGKVMVDNKKYDSLKIEWRDPHITYLYKNGVMGISFDNKVIAQPEYDNIEYATTGYMIVRKKYNRGLIDNTGKIVIPVTHSSLKDTYNPDHDGIIWIDYDDDYKARIITKTPYIQYEMPEMEPMDFKQGPDLEEPNFAEGTFDQYQSIHFTKLFIVEKNGLSGIYNKDLQKVILPIVYTKLKTVDVHIQSGHAILCALKDGKYGIIDETGNTILPFENDDMEIDPNSRMVYFEKDGLEGIYIPHTIYKPIAARYDHIKPYTDINVNGEWSFDIFEASRNGIEFYVGENGVEYYKP